MSTAWDVPRELILRHPRATESEMLGRGQCSVLTDPPDHSGVPQVRESLFRDQFRPEQGIVLVALNPEYRGFVSGALGVRGGCPQAEPHDSSLTPITAALSVLESHLGFLSMSLPAPGLRLRWTLPALSPCTQAGLPLPCDS